MNKVEYSTAPSHGNSRHEPRDKMQSLIRGAHEKCPNCGEGSVFTSYLKVSDNCKNCDEELHHERSDDAAPYFTIFVVGHIIVPLLLILETRIFPPYWIYIAIGVPLLIALTLFILPRVKGALIGWQWALYMHGFDPNEATNASIRTDQEIFGQK